MVEQIVQHFDASGDALDTPTTISYLQGPSGPLYRKSSAEANPSWYVYDGLGSVVGEVDVNGNLTATKSFDVYGATRSYTGNPTTRQGFVGGLGHETDDETGLVYMRARYYDPETGRFVSEDPKKDEKNWFGYCEANPVNLVDKDGKVASPIVNAVIAFFEALGITVSELAVIFGGSAAVLAAVGTAARVFLPKSNGLHWIGEMIQGFGEAVGGGLAIYLGLLAICAASPLLGVLAIALGAALIIDGANTIDEGETGFRNWQNHAYS